MWNRIKEFIKLLILGRRESREDYWNNHFEKKPIYYRAQGDYLRDIRTFLFDKSILLEDFAKNQDLYNGNDDEKIIAILKAVINRTSYKPDKVVHNYEEFWQNPEITLQKKTGDCEDFAIFIKSLSLVVGIPDYKVKICAGWVKDPSDMRRKFGHAYCIYLRDDNTWCVIDGTFFPDRKPVNEREEHKYMELYSDIWFTFNKNFTFSPKIIELQYSKKLGRRFKYLK